MELSAEDSLRLNVLLANPLQAVRIDESAMAVHALSEKGDATVKLNPRGRDDQYLKKVRELLSSQILGSPGGYPIFLRRWTRMGQARDDSLEQLLLLGEPEAVVAVVHAQGLDTEIARRAWWAMPEAYNARRMLEKDNIVQGSMGPVLADYLIDYLPFETEHQAMIETIRLVLQPGLISEQAKQKLWKSAKRKNSYYVGFLSATPDDLLEKSQSHPRCESTRQQLQSLLDAGNPVARQLSRCMSAEGQAYLSIAEIVVNKPNNQDVVVCFLKAVQSYFSAVCPNSDPQADMATIIEDAELLCDVPPVCETTTAVQEVLAVAPDLRLDIQAMLVLAMTAEAVVNPIFSRTDAIGSVMRKKIQPVTQPILKQFLQLRGAV